MQTRGSKYGSVGQIDRPSSYLRQLGSGFGRESGLDTLDTSGWCIYAWNFCDRVGIFMTIGLEIDRAGPPQLETVDNVTGTA